MALDGNEADLDSDVPTGLLPWISLEWDRLAQPVRIGIHGDGAVLKATSARVHAHGRKLRVWGGRDTESAWELLYRGNVDIMHTDHLTRIQRLLGECIGENETAKSGAMPMTLSTPPRAR